MEQPDLVERITNYLECGGIFNPEMMEHDKVRDLLIDCRDMLSKKPTPEDITTRKTI